MWSAPMLIWYGKGNLHKVGDRKEKSGGAKCAGRVTDGSQPEYQKSRLVEAVAWVVVVDEWFFLLYPRLPPGWFHSPLIHMVLYWMRSLGFLWSATFTFGCRSLNAQEMRVAFKSFSKWRDSSVASLKSLGSSKGISSVVFLTSLGRLGL